MVVDSCYICLLLEYRYRKAQLALEKGDEDLAREALKRRKSNAVSLFSVFLRIQDGNLLKFVTPYSFDPIYLSSFLKPMPEIPISRNL